MAHELLNPVFTKDPKEIDEYYIYDDDLSHTTVIYPEVHILTPIRKDEIMETIEFATRTAYQSKMSKDKEKAYNFISSVIERGHESVIEHASLTVLFRAARGVTHEIVRHRIASYTQESTRYCNYTKDKFGKKVTVIKPFELQKDADDNQEKLPYSRWSSTINDSNLYYENLIKDYNATPELARDALTIATKADLVATMNMREWRHFLKLRTSPEAHPHIRQVAIPLLQVLQKELYELFGDIEVKEWKDKPKGHDIVKVQYKTAPSETIIKRD